jgi:DNA-binding transcriptional regulator YiaG
MVRPMSELIDSDDLLERDLQDPEFRAEWERLAAARAVAEMVAENRERKGLTQTALARAIGVRQPVVARIESGEHVPSRAVYCQAPERREDRRRGHCVVWEPAHCGGVIANRHRLVRSDKEAHVRYQDWWGSGDR